MKKQQARGLLQYTLKQQSFSLQCLVKIRDLNIHDSLTRRQNSLGYIFNTREGKKSNKLFLGGTKLPELWVLNE